MLAAAVVNSGARRPKTPLTVSDFLVFGPDRPAAAPRTVLLSDPVQHGKLIAQSIFGKRLH